MASIRIGQSARLPILLLLIAITLVVFDRARPQPFDQLRGIAQTAFSPRGNAATSLRSDKRGQDAQLRKENEELRKQLSETHGALLASQDQQHRLNELQQNLDLLSLGTTKRVVAPVIATRLANFDSAIQLGKGTKSGIKVGMPVVSGAGLVGKVVKVAPASSTVQLLNDSTFEVGVRFSTAGDVAIGVGQGGGREMRVDLVDPGSKVARDDIAVTNGQQFSRFPAGIPVGIVTNAAVQGGEPRKTVNLRPVVDVDRLDYATVLQWESPF